MSTNRSHYNIETFHINHKLSYSIAYEKNAKFPANGGLRLYQYPDLKSQQQEAFVLAKHMTQKHNIYNTGFSGVKIVANGEVTEKDKKILFKHIGKILNKFKGNIYTGCDLNINNEDMLNLNKITPYILNAIKAPQINTSSATAYGVYGSLNAVLNYVEGSKISPKKFLIHGIGKIGSIITRKLLKKGHTVYTYDMCSKNANIKNAINISKNKKWYATKCDYIILCSASGIITEKNVGKLQCKWILSSANSPFSNDNVMKKMKEKNIYWIPDVISNAGAVICDSIEFYEPKYYRTLNAKIVYHFIFNKIKNKTTNLLKLSKEHNLTPQEALNIFLAVSQNEVSLQELLKKC